MDTESIFLVITQRSIIHIVGGYLFCTYTIVQLSNSTPKYRFQVMCNLVIIPIINR